ncbi:NUDIX domain protein (fragment) [Xanthomonas citri pv. fuscans]
MPPLSHDAIACSAARRTQHGMPSRRCSYAAVALTADRQLLQQSGIGCQRPSPAARTQVSLRNRRTDRRPTGAFPPSC